MRAPRLRVVLAYGATRARGHAVLHLVHAPNTAMACRRGVRIVIEATGCARGAIVDARGAGCSAEGAGGALRSALSKCNFSWNWLPTCKCLSDKQSEMT